MLEEQTHKTKQLKEKMNKNTKKKLLMKCSLRPHYDNKNIHFTQNFPSVVSAQQLFQPIGVTRSSD